MNKRLLHSKRPGQSIPLIALIIVVLFGMVGLAVDVGNTYAQQRSAVRATEAATLSGMSTLLESISSGNANADASVWTAIQNSLSSNGITIATYQEGVAQTSDNRLVKAEYLKSDGNPLCTVGSCSGGDLNQATYIQINVDGFNSTYFAKVLGRDTLPVHAQAFAGKCAPTTSVYPFAISSSLLDSSKFLTPTDPTERTHYGFYTDENYQQVYQRRVYEKMAAGSDGYGFVRWKASTSTGTQTYISDGLTGDGNMDLGFEEAAWPSGTVLGASPTGYPAHPGALTTGDSDWIYGNASISGLSTQLTALKTSRTRMILPITDASAGTLASSNLEYHVTKLGSFLLAGSGTETINGQALPYLDLVYVGSVSSVACNITNVIRTTSLGLTGTVLLRPQYTLPPLAHQPVEYTIVLDTSGSMNWNFNGEARVNSSSTGTIVQCGNSSDPVGAQDFIDDATACNNGPKWMPTTERRIAVAKTAIQNFINLMEPYDAMQIIGFSADDTSGGGVAVATTGWQYGSVPGKATLNTATLSAGASVALPYDVSGGTPSATALFQATGIIAASPDISAYDGRTFKKVVLFMTDGVANYFTNTRNPLTGTKKFGWLNDSSDNASCATLAGHTETPSCQIGMTNTNPSFERPITAMASQARAIKNLNGGNVVIYVVALAGVPATGLSTDVASAPTFPFYSEATQGSQVQQIFDAINQSVEDPTCIPASSAFIGVVDSSHTVTSSSSRSGLGLPTDTSIYGYVYLQDSHGATLQTAPITHQNGQLSYSFANVAPGNSYQLAAFVGYLGDDSPNKLARSYGSILLPDLSHSTSRSLSMDASKSLNNVVPADPLYLDLSGNVCPNGG